MQKGGNLINFEKFGLSGPIDLVLNLLIITGLLYVLYGVVLPRYNNTFIKVVISAITIVIIVAFVYPVIKAVKMITRGY